MDENDLQPEIRKDLERQLSRSRRRIREPRMTRRTLKKWRRDARPGPFFDDLIILQRGGKAGLVLWWLSTTTPIPNFF